jgi:hypothetical protein
MVAQKEKAFQRGISMSFLQSKIGNKKLPRVPIKIGMIEKKIITKACAVIKA